MTKILHYSDNDFPILEPPNSRLDGRNSKLVDGSRPRRTVVEQKTSQKGDDVVTSSKTGRKVLKPHEHKETYSVNIDDALNVGSSFLLIS